MLVLDRCLLGQGSQVSRVDVYCFCKPNLTIARRLNPDDRSRNVGCQARPVKYDYLAPPIHEGKDENSMQALLGTTTNA